MTGKGLSIVGCGSSRAPLDFYPTPEYVTDALLAREQFTNPSMHDSNCIWEPAAGDGAMSKVLSKNIRHVISSDIREGPEVYGAGGKDFLTWTCPNIYSYKNISIITNPPYRYAKEFVERAKEVANYKIAMFLKLSFLESAKRYELFKDRGFPLKKVYVFSKRVTLAPKGVTLKNKGLIAYAWYVWDKSYTGEATLDWIL